MGEPTSPNSMVGALTTADPRLLFGLGEPNRLIRIIGLQSSSGPNRPQPPAARRCPQSTPSQRLLQRIRILMSAYTDIARKQRRCSFHDVDVHHAGAQVQ